jgi:hypothetical protein
MKSALQLLARRSPQAKHASPLFLDSIRDPTSSDIDPRAQNGAPITHLESTLAKVYQNKEL